MRALLGALAALALLGGALPSPAAAADEFGIEAVEAALAETQAGAHADFTTNVVLNTDETTQLPIAPVSTLRFDLSPGLSGNPAAFPKCTALQLTTSVKFGVPAKEDEVCPIDSQVGVSKVKLAGLKDGFATVTEPVYNMVPSGEDVVARLGFVAQVLPVIVDIRLDPESAYRLSATSESLSGLKILASAQTTLWGDPTHPSHDALRVTPYEAATCPGSPCTAPGKEARHSSLAPTPFMSNPTSCGAPGTLGVHAASYEQPDLFVSAFAPLPQIGGCGLLDFSPQISLRPTTRQGASPAGMDVALTLPQQGLEHPGLLAQSHLKKTVVELPPGLTVNPAAAGGLGACTAAQVGLASKSPIRFNAAAPTCPDSSKVGTGEIKTPVLPEPVPASLYLADQSDNPFDALLSGYLVARGQGVTLKLAGRFDVAPDGQITATFDENPQQPFGEVRLHFQGGVRGTLVTPGCGTHQIDSTLTSWSGGDAVQLEDSFEIDSGPGGGPCPAGALEPQLVAGTANPTAGAASPFSLALSRRDGTDVFTALSTATPEGLTARLAGVPYCPQGAIDAARSRSAPGTGAAELVSPSCPAASQVGAAIAGAGAGPDPFYVQSGRLYLAGPYAGAPLSLVAVVPAVAGPFDLGVVVDRIALRIDPRSARVSAIADPLPSALHGIQLAVREVRVAIDRPGFTRNPTDCSPMAVYASVAGTAGRSATLSHPFQATGCGGLGFKPRLAVRLFGATKRGAYQRVRAVLRARPGDANIGGASVRFPTSAFLAQEHIRTVCTRVQFAAGACPKASIYGRATATTPLLDYPLTGPVYLRSSTNLLPDLVADLRGPAYQPIRIELSGRTDSVKGALRNTFDVAPDAPVTKFTLNLFGGKRGLIVNSRNLCSGRQRATVRLRAQNGRRRTLRPVVRNSCSKKKRAKRSAGHVSRASRAR